MTLIRRSDPTLRETGLEIGFAVMLVLCYPGLFVALLFERNLGTSSPGVGASSYPGLNLTRLHYTMSPFFASHSFVPAKTIAQVTI